MGLEGYRGTELEKAQASTVRYPRYKVVIWNPAKTTIQDIVMERWKGIEVDISRWVQQVSVTHNQVFENNDDAVSSRASLVLRWDDQEGIDLGSRRIYITNKLFRNGTPIRIYEGDDRVYRDGWVPVFTGVCRGFSGADVAARNPRSVTVQAFGRAQAFQNHNIVGISFPYKTDLGGMAVETAMTELGLERPEIRFGLFDFQVLHKVTAIVDTPKMQALFDLMTPVQRKPYFDGLGRLVAHDTSFDKPALYSFTNSKLIKAVRRIQNLSSTVSSVNLLGLDHNLTKVVNQARRLGEVTVTLGYFESNYDEIIFYSDDHRLRAQNTYLNVRKSGPGGDASWTEIDEFSGRLDLDSGYAPWIVGTIITVWVSLAVLEAVYDAAIDAATIDFWSIAARLAVSLLKAALMVLAMVTMTKIGTWIVEVWGEPFEYVYKQLRSIASLEGVPSSEIIEQNLRMDVLSDTTTLNARAKAQLRRETSKGQTFEIEMMSNASIEPDDIIEIKDERYGIDSFWRFYITEISRQFKSGPADDTMRLLAWKIGETDE